MGRFLVIKWNFKKQIFSHGEPKLTITVNSRIFVSYSHQGTGPQWKEAFLHALTVFGQQHLLDVWQDGKIRVSSFRDDDRCGP